MKCVLFNSVYFCPCRSCLSEKPADGVCWRTRGSGSSLRKQLGFVSEGRLTAFTMWDVVWKALLKRVVDAAAAAPAESSFAGPRWVSAGCWASGTRDLARSGHRACAIAASSAGWCKTQRAGVSGQAAGVSQCQQLCRKLEGSPRARPGVQRGVLGQSSCWRSSGWAEGTSPALSSQHEMLFRAMTRVQRQLWCDRASLWVLQGRACTRFVHFPWLGKPLSFLLDLHYIFIKINMRKSTKNFHTFASLSVSCLSLNVLGLLFVVSSCWDVPCTGLAVPQQWGKAEGEVRMLWFLSAPLDTLL